MDWDVLTVANHSTLMFGVIGALITAIMKKRGTSVGTGVVDQWYAYIPVCQSPTATPLCGCSSHHHPLGTSMRVASPLSQQNSFGDRDPEMGTCRHCRLDQPCDLLNGAFFR